LRIPADADHPYRRGGHPGRGRGEAGGRRCARHDQEQVADKTRHPKILVGKMRVYEQERIEKGLAWLAAGVGLEPAPASRCSADSPAI
jgi:hypothetical protein